MDAVQPILSSYPLNIEVVCADRVARWRPLFNWVLVIPLWAWRTVLGWGAWVVVVLGWFAIVLTGRLPRTFGDYLVAVLRYRWRTLAYLFGLTARYPGFRTVAGYVDAGDHPAVLYSARPVARRRLGVAFRLILLIPQLVALIFVGWAAEVVLVVGWFAVLLRGRWPPTLQAFLVGWMRWNMRVMGYGYLLVDEYPPFGIRV